MEQITEAIKLLRRTLSQSEISRRTGIAQSKISRWEAGDVPAGATDALRLVDLANEVSTSTSAPDRTPTEEGVSHG